MIIITFIATIVVMFIALLSAVSDIRSLRIPNWHSAVILLCFLPAWLASPESFSPLWQHIASMLVMFVISYLIFTAGIMGGGDSKLATALALWFGLKGVVGFILYMSIMGGLIGVITLIIRNKKPFKTPLQGGWVEQAQLGKNAIPYGVAIAFGFWVYILHTSIIFNHVGEVFKTIH